MDSRKTPGLSPTSTSFLDFSLVNKMCFVAGEKVTLVFLLFFFWFGGVLLLGFVVPKVEVSSKLRCYRSKFSGCHERMFISLLSQMAYRL